MSRKIAWLRPSRLLLVVLSLSLTASAATAEPPRAEADQKAADSAKWVRVLRDDAGKPIAMQTAIVRYRSADVRKDGPTVDLIGAVHVGDRAYYKNLNEEFTKYDALLFELVAPKNVKPTKGKKSSSTHPVGALQNGMKSMLKLEHQLEWIDYSKENFVHADMTPEQFSKSMTDRNEGFMQMFFRMMGRSLAEQSKQQAKGKSSDLDILLALFDKNRAYRLKCIMAEQFEGMESLMTSFGGPDGSTIITERNKVALKVLAEQLKTDKRRIGVFYGAGHLDDMDKRLRDEFKLAPVSTRWMTAWDLSDPTKKNGKK